MGKQHRDFGGNVSLYSVCDQNYSRHSLAGFIGFIFIRRGAVDTRIETDLSANQISSAITVVASMNAKETGDNKRVFVLKEEVGTLPRFFYYFDV